MPRNTTNAHAKVPLNCGYCPIRRLTICSPVVDRHIDIVQSFKSGNKIFPQQKYLYRQGERSEEIHNLLDGIVMISKDLSSGERQVLDFAFPGAFLGYQTPADQPVSHTAQCITDVAVCVFPKRGFRALLTRHPDLALRLTELAVEDLERMHRYLANMGCRSARRSVAYLLVLLYQRVQLFTSYNAARGDVSLPITQGRMADALGITNVYINRILHGFQEEGLLSCTGGRVTILNPTGLSRIAHAGLEPAAA